jgi:Mannitol-1-phosphate/altronate dehydrogenases
MKLNEKILNKLGAQGVKVPSYDRGRLETGWVHLGPGHFHRSHLLTYMDELLDKGGKGATGIYEIDMLSEDVGSAASWKEQNYLYTLSELSPDGERRVRVNGAVTGLCLYKKEPGRALAVLTSPSVSLCSLTITEKGYCYLDDVRTLDFSHPDIRHDMESDEMPRSAVGLLSLVLKIRAERNLPITLLSMDNIPGNGDVLRRSITAFSSIKYPELAEKLSSIATFPLSMVDRITPATRPEDFELLESLYGITDSEAIRSESYLEWVVQSAPFLPDFSSVGALVTNDVLPYEHMKIRLLNGAHSALAYPALMMGYERVDEALSDERIRRFIRECYMKESEETLSPCPGRDFDQYEDMLIRRFSSAAVSDRLMRLAEDGSKKIANAIFPSIAERLASGRNAEALILSVALWREAFNRKDGEYVKKDPLYGKLLAAKDNALLFLETAGFSKDSETLERTAAGLDSFAAQIEKKGVEKVLEEFISR